MRIWELASTSTSVTIYTDWIIGIGSSSGRKFRLFFPFSLFSVLASTLFNFGSLLGAVLIKALIPNKWVSQGGKETKESPLEHQRGLGHWWPSHWVLICCHGHGNMYSMWTTDRPEDHPHPGGRSQFFDQNKRRIFPLTIVFASLPYCQLFPSQLELFYIKFKTIFPLKI